MLCFGIRGGAGEKYTRNSSQAQVSTRTVDLTQNHKISSIQLDIILSVLFLILLLYVHTVDTFFYFLFFSRVVTFQLEPDNKHLLV